MTVTSKELCNLYERVKKMGKIDEDRISLCLIISVRKETW
jgi:hypothetical protein